MIGSMKKVSSVPIPLRRFMSKVAPRIPILPKGATVNVPPSIAEFTRPNKHIPIERKKKFWQTIKPATLNELPIPQGSWQLAYAAKQKWHNTLLFVGIVVFGISMTIAPNFITVGRKPWDKYNVNPE